MGRDIDQHRGAARELVANLLRVMRGHGRDYQIAGDIEAVAERTKEIECNVGRSKINLALVEEVRSWEDRYIASLSKVPSEEERIEVERKRMEYGVCRAALRMVASSLEGNSTEISKAHREIWEEIGYYNKFLREWQESREVEAILSLGKEKKRYIEREKRAERQNKTVLLSADSSATCYVYFITDGDAIKIGKAVCPKSRLGGLQTSHYKPLRILHLIPGNEDVERRLHGKFHKHRIRGEWFKDCRDIRDFIRASAPMAANDDGAAHAAAA